MNPLFYYLEQLLVVHDCVVIPSLGAVLKEPIAARYDVKQGLIYPAGEQYHFNNALMERDGLLERCYAEAYAVSLRRAQIILTKDVEEAKQLLLEHKELTLGSIGLLKLQSNGSIDFIPSDREKILGCGSAYGLLPMPFRMASSRAEVIAMESLRKQQPKSSLRFRIDANTFARAAALFVVLFALLPFLSPSSSSRYSAGFVSVSPEQNKEVEAAPKVIEETTPTEEPSTNLVPIQEEAQKYFIIIASFTTDARCEQFIASQKDHSFAATIGTMRKGKHILVYTNGYATQDEALKAREELIEAYPKEHASAWIFNASALQK